MFVIMLPSLSQSQMMEMTPMINDYFCGNQKLNFSFSNAGGGGWGES
jgi:hypothetical protein